MLSGSLDEIIKFAEQLDYILYVKEASDQFVYINKFTENLIGMDLEGLNKRDRKSFPFEPLFHNDTHLIKSDAGATRIYYLEDENIFKRQTCFFIGKISLNRQYLVACGCEITDQLTDISKIDFYRTVINAMGDSVAITENKEPYRVLFANQSFLKLTNYASIEDILGKTFEQLFGSNPLKDGHSSSSVIRSKRFGKPFVVKTRIIPLLNTPYIMCIQYDVTSEEELKELDGVKAEKLKALFNTTSNYLWLLDDKGRILEMNRSSCNQGRYLNPSLYEGMDFSKGRWWKSNAETRDKIEDALEEVIRKGKDVNLTVDFLNAQDEIIIVSVEMKANRSVEGDLTYIVVEAHDITSLKNQKDRAVELIKSETNLNEKEIDSFVQGNNPGLFEKEDLVRMTQTETILNQQVLPTLAGLKQQFDEVVMDPEKGLQAQQIHMADSVESLNSQMKDLTSLNDFAKSITGMAEWAQKPVIKWFLIFLVGGAGLGAVSTWVDKIEQIRDVILEVEKADSTRQLVPPINPNSTPSSD